MMYFARWKVILILAVLVLGFIFALPNLLPARIDDRIPGFLPHLRISLGLDLQGGSHLLLQADMESVVRERLAGIVDGFRTELRKANIGYTGLGIDGHTVKLTLRDKNDIEKARPILQGVAENMDLSISPDGQVTATYTDATIKEIAQNAIQQSIEIVRRRVDETGTREPTIQRQGTDQILVQLPGLQDPERIKALLGKTAKMTFRLVDQTVTPDDAAEGRLPPTSEILPLATPRPGEEPSYVVQKRVMVSGESLTDAQATYRDAEPVVNFKFDSVGARRFCDVTKNNIGKPFAIVLDNKVISAPVIREPILGGSGIISGSFTVQSASDLALLLRAGALPAPITILEERTVGPSLGADSIRAGALACIVGVALVVVFMVLFYGLFGVFADIALFFNLCLMLGSLTLLGATLTLPGIAGIALTMGMAVDAKVLIYERIREEVRAGRTMLSSLDAGFTRAFGTIVDSHVTTLVAGALMFWLGSGPVKGFAVTLSIGVLTSLFSAILVTRLLIVTWVRRWKPREIPI